MRVKFSHWTCFIIILSMSLSGRSLSCLQVRLTQNIEDFFEAKKKAGVVFINLTAAYDTVRHRGFTCKLLMLLPDERMVKKVMDFFGNYSFTLLPVTASKAGYGVRNWSWLPSFSTSTVSNFITFNGVCPARRNSHIADLLVCSIAE